MAKRGPLLSPPNKSAATAAPGRAIVLPGWRDLRPGRWISPSALLFVLPALILMGVFVVYPTIKTIYLSFFTQTGIGYNAPLTFTGGSNYAQMASDDSIRTAVINNLLWLIIVTPVAVVLGVILAVLFDRVRYEVVAKSIIFIHMAISATAGGALWKLMYWPSSQTGTVDAILAHFIPNFQPIAFLGRSDFVNFALMFAFVWSWLGFALVILSAALKAIPKDLVEAARIDGANELRIFFRITVPLMWPTITVIATLAMIATLKIFDIVWTMTGEGPAGSSAVLATRMYVESFQNADYGYGSAIAVVLLIAVLPVMILNIRNFRVQGSR